jgi:Tfp pilus assembly protein PilN
MSQQINLYNPVFRKQEKVFSAAAMVQGLVLIAAVVATFAFYVSMQSSVLEIRAAQSGQQLKGELERLKTYGGARESPAERAKALADRRKALEARLVVQKQALAALDSGALGRGEGHSGTLRALARVSMDGVWLTGIAIGEGERGLSLAGRAANAELVPAYLERLRSEEVLRRSFSHLEIRRAAVAPGPAAAPSATVVEFTLGSSAAAERKEQKP